MNRLPLSPTGLIALLGAGASRVALGVVASTHHAREGYARLQDLELQRWQLQEQYTRSCSRSTLGLRLIASARLLQNHCLCRRLI